MKFAPALAISAHPSLPPGAAFPSGGGSESPSGKNFCPFMTSEPVAASTATATPPTYPLQTAANGVRARRWSGVDDRDRDRRVRLAAAQELEQSFLPAVLVADQLLHVDVVDDPRVPLEP